MFKRILAGILSAAIVFSSLTPAVNATESVAVSQEETTDQEVIEEEITEEEKEEDKIESEIKESVEEIEIQEEQMVETMIIEEVVAEEQIAQTLNTPAPIDESERGEIATGACGDNLTWILYDDGELVISGEGAMDVGENGYNYSWDDYAEEIKMVVISDGITTIGQSAFTGIDSLKKISIPSSVLIIEDYAFETCASIEDIVLPEGIESIGKTAFGRCKALKTITLPKTIKSIGAYAFQNTDSLETIFYNGTWNDWVEFSRTLTENIYIKDSQICTIQKYVSEKNEDETITITGSGEGGLGGKIQIPEEIDGLKVTAIGEQAFFNNKNILSVSFPSSVEIINKSAFFGCELEEINFTTGLKHIMDYAFYDSINNYNYNLILPEGLQTIGSNAFSGVNIKSFTIPASVEEIGLPSFDWDENIIFDDSAQKWIDIHNANKNNVPILESVSFSKSEQAYVPYVDSNGNITGYELALWRDATGDIEIREKFKELPVISIRQSAFADNETITSVVVPEYIKSIGNGAFQNCVNLVEAKINTKETSVPWQVFQGCISLKKVTLPPLITYVGSDAFDQCISLEEVSFESSYNWNTINFDSGNASLINAKTKNFKHDWGYKVDNYYENNIKEEGIEIIGKSIFEKEMVFPSEIHGLPVRAIGDQSSVESFMTGSAIIESVQLPESLTYLCSGAFKNCVKLEKIILPDSLEDIHVSTFEGCTNLAEIKFPEKLNIIGESAFKGCTNISEISFPNKLTFIEESAFEGCIKLESITFPEKVIAIYDHAFKNCKLVGRITFKSKDEILLGCHAFSGCTNIKIIDIAGQYVNTVGGWCSDISDYDEVLPSAFEGVPRTASVKVIKDSSAYRRMVELGFKNLSVAIVLNEIKLPSSFAVEYGKSKTATITKVPVQANDPLNLVWTSLDESIATVDENGVITGKNLGSTQITVKDLNSGETAKTTVQVILPGTSKITTKMSPAIDSLGLQSGQSVIMQIFATGIGNDEVLDPSLFTFTSSDDSVVTVDEYGVIQSVYKGTKAISVKITAKLNNDPSGRKVYISVKTIPVQVEELQYYVSEDVEFVDGTVVIPKLKVAEGDYSFGIYAQPLNSEEELIPASLKWTSSNSKVATVASDGMVTVKKNADGIATITATVNDLKKAKATINIDVRDYSPRLAANTVILNTNTYEEAQVQIYPVYETEVKSVRLEGNEYLYADYKEDNGNHTITIRANDVVKKGTYKLNLIAEIEGKGEYVQSFTVKVANSIPAITVKQTSAFNLFYLDSNATVNITAKNAVVADAYIDDTDTFKSSEFDTDNSALTLTYDNFDSILDKKATLYIKLEGYREPIQKAFNINAKEVKPVLSQSRTSTKLSSLSSVGVPMEITDKSTKQVINWANDSVDVSVYESSVDYVDVNWDETQLIISPILRELKFVNEKTSHAAKLEIQGENWLKPIVISHTISINTKLPTIKAKSTTLTLNRLFGNEVQTEIIPSLSNCPVPVDYEIEALNESVKDLLTVDAEGWNLTAKFADIDNLPVKGSYKYNVIANIEGEEIKTTVTIKVTESTPKVTLGKTTVSLNKTVEDYIEFAASAASGYEIVDMDVSPATGNDLTKNQLSVEFNADTKMVTATIFDKTIVNKTYKYLLTPLVKAEGADSEIEPVVLKPITLSVKVHGNKVSVTTSVKGSIDLVTRDNGIVYTITGGKNFNYHLEDILAEDIKIYGESANLFDIDVLEPNEKGQPQLMVKAKSDAELSTVVTYKYKLLVKVDGFENEIETAEFKVKPKQTKLSLQASGNLNIYQSVKNGEIRIELIKPADAKIQDLQILSTKATTVPEGALDYQVIESGDGTYVVRYSVKQPDKLKVNAGYKLSLSVTPEGNASNQNPQTFTITLKAKR